MKYLILLFLLLSGCLNGMYALKSCGLITGCENIGYFHTKESCDQMLEKYKGNAVICEKQE